MNITKQQAVISSTSVVSVNLKNFKDVSSRKQNPKKLDEEFNIWPDLLLLLFAVAIKSAIQLIYLATKMLYNIQFKLKAGYKLL